MGIQLKADKHGVLQKLITNHPQIIDAEWIANLLAVLDQNENISGGSSLK